MHLLLVPCLQLSKDTPKSRRKLWQQSGPVRSSQIMSLGGSIHLETDHKPLVPHFCTTHLDRMPPRVLRFRLRLTRFDYTIQHVPGKSLYTADALSRAPETSQPSCEEYSDTEYLIGAIVSLLPTNADRLEYYRKAQSDDDISSKCIEFCHTVATQTPSERGPGLVMERERTAIYRSVTAFSYMAPELSSRNPSELKHFGRFTVAIMQGVQKCRQRVMTQCGGQELHETWKTTLCHVQSASNRTPPIERHSFKHLSQSIHGNK